MSLILLFAAALSFTKPEMVTATFASEADAQKAEIGIAPLPDGKKVAFTSRWDDSTPAHVERSEMFKRVGMQPMFFLNGKLYDAKGGEFRVPVKKGLNRLLYVWKWFQPWTPKAFLLSVCDDKSVDKAAKFVTPKTEKIKKDR